MPTSSGSSCCSFRSGSSRTARPRTSPRSRTDSATTAGRRLPQQHLDERREPGGTLALLGDLGFTHIRVDELQGFKSSVAPVAAATSDIIAFVRFHGENAETWEK